MKIYFQAILETIGRITGISTPIGGVSWEPSISETRTARNTIIYLENKRALYELHPYENPQYLSSSIFEIRLTLTQTLQTLNPKSKLALHIREMRNACLSFNKATDRLLPNHKYYRHRLNITWGDKEKIYFREVGRMREKVGYHISLIASEYNIEVESNLAKIMPKNKSQ